MPFLSFPWQVDHQWYLPINFSFAARAPNIIGDEPFTVHLPAWIPAINRSSGYMAMCVCVCVKNQIKAFADITKWRPFVHTQSTDKVLLPVFFLHASLPYVWVCLFLLVHHVVFFFFIPASLVVHQSQAFSTGGPNRQAEETFYDCGGLPLFRKSDGHFWDFAYKSSPNSNVSVKHLNAF